jgi:hypothetical protein
LDSLVSRASSGSLYHDVTLASCDDKPELVPQPQFMSGFISYTVLLNIQTFFWVFDIDLEPIAAINRYPALRISPQEFHKMKILTAEQEAAHYKYERATRRID